MGKLKKIAMVFLLFVVSTGVAFLIYWAYYPMEILEVHGKASTTPQGSFISKPMDDGNKCILYTENLRVDVDIYYRFSFYKDIIIKKVSYELYLEDAKIGEGSFQDVLIESVLTTELPTVQHLLNVEELVKNRIDLVEAASQNRGLQELRLIVKTSTPAMFLDLIRIGTAEKVSEISLNINIIDTVNVLEFEWKSGYTTVTDCNPGDELVGELRVWKNGELGKNLEAEIIEVLEDGSFRPCTSFPIDEGLTEGYNTLNINWVTPDSPPIDCVGYSVCLIYEDLEVWNQIENDSLRVYRVLSLLDAFTEEGITICLSGRGYCSGEAVNLKVKLEIEPSLDLKIESGTILYNSGDGQNMIVAETSTVRVEPGIEVEVKIETYCLDMHKDNPSQEETFTIYLDHEYAVDAVKLMNSLSRVSWEHRTVKAIQLALWAIIDDPTQSEVSQIFRFSDSDLEDAAWLLDNVGVDITQKNLFNET
jgi:hypothetical protein